MKFIIRCILLYQQYTRKLESLWLYTSAQNASALIPSQWLQRQDGNILTIQVRGEPVEHRSSPDCLPYLMLLDMVQMTYLQMSNSDKLKVEDQETFYKGVLFLDSLRGDFLAAIQKAPQSQAGLVPASMQRWLCRLLHNIPHDPHHRKRHAETLNKAYLAVDVSKYGMPGNFALAELLINSQNAGF